jgi:hypothetical protein
VNVTERHNKLTNRRGCIPRVQPVGIVEDREYFRIWPKVRCCRLRAWARLSMGTRQLPALAMRIRARVIVNQAVCPSVCQCVHLSARPHASSRGRCHWCGVAAPRKSVTGAGAIFERGLCGVRSAGAGGRARHRVHAEGGHLFLVFFCFLINGLRARASCARGRRASFFGFFCFLINVRRARASCARRRGGSFFFIFFKWPQGQGIVCTRKKGIAAGTFIGEYLGELYSAWAWFEKHGAAAAKAAGASRRSRTRMGLPDFCNCMLERPKADKAGYDAFFVDVRACARVC